MTWQLVFQWIVLIAGGSFFVALFASMAIESTIEKYWKCRREMQREFPHR